MVTGKRDLRNGVDTARGAPVPNSAGMYVTYATRANGTVSERPTRWPTAEYNSERLLDLRSLLLWARSLLTLATHGTMKDALGLVVGEVEERLRSLLQEEAGQEPTVLMAIDLTTARARCRLKMIADTFKTAGLDAEFNPAAWP